MYYFHTHSHTHARITHIYDNFQELEEYCFNFFLKNQTDVMQAESFTQLDINTKIMFITKANNFFISHF